MQEIRIKIKKDGTVNLSAKGIKGKSCKDATKEIEEIFGITASVEKTSEYYEQGVNITNEVKVGGKK